MRILSYVKVALFTTVNILLNGVTLGRYVWLEGRVERGVFTNWARRFRYVPKRFAKPATEQEIVELIRNAGSVRVFGSGHSFNSGVVSEETLVSLDDYSGLVWKDLDKKQVAAKGGYTGTGRRCSTARRRAGLQGTTFPRRPEHRGSPVDRRARDGEGVGVRQRVGRGTQTLRGSRRPDEGDRGSSAPREVLRDDRRGVPGKTTSGQLYDVLGAGRPTRS